MPSIGGGVATTRPTWQPRRIVHIFHVVLTSGVVARPHCFSAAHAISASDRGAICGGMISLWFISTRRASLAGTHTQPLRRCHPELPEALLSRISTEIEMVALE